MFFTLEVIFYSAIQSILFRSARQWLLWREQIQ